MWPDRVSNPGPLTYESGALPIALRGPAHIVTTIRLLLLKESGVVYLYYFLFKLSRFQSV